ncbi:MAG TPA: hypothetical protein VM581_00465, partial [Magnetospirillaceae bacterium]|nr:hypothetical protein [Magnetospirillaceae bacterium]
VYCQPHNPFDITQAHAIYCVAPAASPGSDVASAPFGTIVLPGEHFKTEVGNAPGDHKQGVSVMMAYFYTLHIRQLLRQAGLISALWGEASKTQWCLTGVSLRALGVVYLPSVAPASLTPESLLPLNLTHVFSGQDVDDLHGKWVLEGFIHGSLNRCFV